MPSPSISIRTVSPGSRNRGGFIPTPTPFGVPLRVGAGGDSGGRGRGCQAGRMARVSDEEVDFLLGVLDLARQGRDEELAALLDRGVPANLTNAAGDSLLILAAYHDHFGIVLDRVPEVRAPGPR